MPWLDDEDEDEDYLPSDSWSDMVDDIGDDSITDEEYEDMADPTDEEDYG